MFRACSNCWIDNCKVTKKNVGKIDLKGAYSFFEVDADKADAVMNGLTNIEFSGRQVRVEATSGKNDESRGEGRDFKRKKFSGNSNRSGGGGGGYGKSQRSGEQKRKRW